MFVCRLLYVVSVGREVLAALVGCMLCWLYVVVCCVYAVFLITTPFSSCLGPCMDVCVVCMYVT